MQRCDEGSSAASPEVGPRGLASLFGFTTFLSALLLFSLQPMIARAILPWFGGAAGVWNCAQFFFQGVLLCGYLYAHLTITRTRFPFQGRSRALRQAILHGVLIACSLFFLPVLPSPQWKPTVAQDPAVQVLLTLIVTVGLPYLILSSTSPLLASWYRRLFPGRSPYPLFAWSNFGSLLGLLGYPLFIEPALGVRHQIYLWSVGYLLCGGLLGFLAYRQREVSEGAEQPAEPQRESAAPGADTWLLWFSLPACTSVLLISITHYISIEIAAVPLLWVIPLALFLVSYIIVASSWNLYRRWLFYPPFLASLYGLTRLLDAGTTSPQLVMVGMWAALGILFVVCHGELWRTRPQTEYLSHFYLLMSVGGACGSFLVAYVAPHIFDRNYELTIAIFVCPLLVIWSSLREKVRQWSSTRTAVALLVALPLVYGFGHLLVATELKESSYRMVSVRNFYGTSWVGYVTNKGSRYPAYRFLVNGRINHGRQYTAPERQGFPTSYFGKSSGIGRMLTWCNGHRPPMKVGIVGLGVGTLAAYARPGDDYVFYELDPKIEQLALRYFYYLPNCQARLRTVLGDARLSLENEAPGQFDVLVIDAFTGDSIPVHLLTQEAFKVYKKVLKPDGVLALHISNLYLDLPPVVAAQAGKVEMEAYKYYDDGVGDPLVNGSLWAGVFPSRHPALADLSGQGFTAMSPAGSNAYEWTDDSNNLLGVLKRAAWRTP